MFCIGCQIHETNSKKDTSPVWLVGESFRLFGHTVLIALRKK